MCEYRLAHGLLQVHLVVHVFQLSEEGAADDDEGTEGAGSIYREWMLPAREFHNMWDALLYEDDIKSRLLRYATTVHSSPLKQLCQAGVLQ